MRILHINTSDWGGGAAIAGYRLHEALRRTGKPSCLLVGKQSQVAADIREFIPQSRMTRRISRRFRRWMIGRCETVYRKTRPSGYEDFSDCRSQFGRELLSQLGSPGIINLHWIAGFVDYPAFFLTVPPKVPVVWTVHDMNPFTGGCHYDHGCGKYKNGCGGCPQLGSSTDNDLSRKNWSRKKNIFENVPTGRLHLVAPSRWMADRIQKSPLLGHFPMSVIPNSLDTEVFRPIDRDCARKLLGIPEGAKVILFVADSVTNRRKGISLLLDALEGLKSIEGMFLVTVGRSRVSVSSSIPYLNIGGVSNHHLLPAVYSAANIFVIPSQQDNLPNTVIESMACGTPVVGFNTGGIPDMVKDGVTGCLANPGDVRGLGQSITGILQDCATQEFLSEQCRRAAERDYSMQRQAEQYIRLYEGMV